MIVYAKKMYNTKIHRMHITRPNPRTQRKTLDQREERTVGGQESVDHPPGGGLKYTGTRNARTWASTQLNPQSFPWPPASCQLGLPGADVADWYGVSVWDASGDKGEAAVSRGGARSEVGGGAGVGAWGVSIPEGWVGRGVADPGVGGSMLERSTVTGGVSSDSSGISTISSVIFGASTTDLPFSTGFPSSSLALVFPFAFPPTSLLARVVDSPNMRAGNGGGSLGNTIDRLNGLGLLVIRLEMCGLDTG